MKKRIEFLRAAARLAGCPFVAALIAMSCNPALAQPATLDVVDDTVILNNGGDQETPGFDSDQEDNFGGRNEAFIGSNNADPRTLLLRFDPSSLADDINDPLRVVASAELQLFGAPDNRGADINPAGPTTFGVFSVNSANAGWVEGTRTGSSSGFSGEVGSVSRAFRVTPSQDDITNDSIPFDAFWRSGRQFNNAVSGSEAPDGNSGFNSDTDALLGVTDFVEADTPETNTLFSFSLDPGLVNSLLAEWLPDPTGNAGLAVDRLDGATGQWFLSTNESNNGPGTAANLVVEFVTIPEPGTIALTLMAMSGAGAVCLRRRLG